jgi:hypothetical protein
MTATEAGTNLIGFTERAARGELQPAKARAAIDHALKFDAPDMEARRRLNFVRFCDGLRGCLARVERGDAQEETAREVERLKRAAEYL